MAYIFQSDPEKARQNRLKHGVSFEEATTAFGDPLSVTLPDPLHSKGEEREILIGNTVYGKTIVVVFTHRARIIRIISARRATNHERLIYETDG